MNEIRINEKISYIKGTENPLSADIGVIRDGGIIWYFDVGCGEKCMPAMDENCNIVLSHFHQDHIGNIDKMKFKELFVSNQTYKYVQKGIIVSEDLYRGNLHIFSLPSSHAKGCLGLEIDNTYAFVGDALYCKRKDGCLIYNAQLLKQEIEVLKKLQASVLLVSHKEGMVREKKDVIAELEEIYSMRSVDSPEIRLEESGEN